MKKIPIFFTLLLLVVFTFCFSGVAQALMVNEDFSNGFTDWSTYGGPVLTDYASLPAEYTNKWDLSSWNNVMDGSFALLSGGGMFKKFPITKGEIPSSISFDYAVAWADPVISNPPGYATSYFWVETRGIVTGDSRRYDLTHNEIQWSTNGSIQQDVFTNTLNFERLIKYPDKEFDEIYIEILARNPNGSLDSIIGIDNIKIAGSAPAPVPEPSTMLMLGMGLAGLARYGRRSRMS